MGNRMWGEIGSWSKADLDVRARAYPSWMAGVFPNAVERGEEMRWAAGCEAVSQSVCCMHCLRAGHGRAD